MLSIALSKEKYKFKNSFMILRCGTDIVKKIDFDIILTAASCPLKGISC